MTDHHARRLFDLLLFVQTAGIIADVCLRRRECQLLAERSQALSEVKDNLAEVRGKIEERGARP